MSIESATSLLTEVIHADEGITVLTGAGISAESGIPTFRGPEGYWRVGSKEYRPEEMATQAMFLKDPWEVWSWYLYRRTICSKAVPNQGHIAIAAMASSLGNRFRLITQNVDGLHLRAGNTGEKTYQIHGNIHYMRCAQSCCRQTFPIPSQIEGKGKNEVVNEAEKKMLVCPQCAGPARPHVLWFDEYYNEHFFCAESAVQWARETELLLVIGTSGATSLPIQIGEVIFRKPNAVLIDVNPQPNPFRQMAEAHPNGIVFQGNSGEVIPRILETWDVV